MTTYQLQADDMIARHGHEQALILARRFAKNGDHFWTYVVECIKNASTPQADTKVYTCHR